MSAPDSRRQRAEVLSFSRILEHTSGYYSVPSESTPGQRYHVYLAPVVSCQCRDFELHGQNDQKGQECKHVLAVRLWLLRGSPPVTTPPPEPAPRKTYRQDWPAYNLAQTTEKHRVQVLLRALCAGIPEPERSAHKPGRKPHLLRDMVFASAFKVYSTVSARRFHCDLQDAHARGYLCNPVPGLKVSLFLEDAALTPILRDLIVQSSLPLRVVETTFAPDSTGFSTSRFVRWFDEKYGVERSGRGWVKAHAISGVKSNIVTALEIHDKDAADCPQFKSLVETTAQNFTVKEVPADKAYLSRESLELVEKLGGTAYVPFKVNSVAGEAGSLWEKMFHYYQFRREEFLAHYHQRSNAESTFSMIKAKFGDAVRSRTDTAMRNEVYCKFLMHNLCVVHQSHIELGIEPVFWASERVETPVTLPFARPS